jgi:hypothetical protein
MKLRFYGTFEFRNPWSETSILKSKGVKFMWSKVQGGRIRVIHSYSPTGVSCQAQDDAAKRGTKTGHIGAHGRAQLAYITRKWYIFTAHDTIICSTFLYKFKSHHEDLLRPARRTVQE